MSIDDVVSGSTYGGNDIKKGGNTNTNPESETPIKSGPVLSGKWINPKKGTNIGLPIIYGTRRIGGILIYQEVSTDDNLLYKTFALAEGEQQAWTVYVNNVSYTSSKYYNASDSLRHIDVYAHTGNDTGLNSGSGITRGASWTTSHLSKGIASESLTFVYDALKRSGSATYEEEPFFESLPKIEFEMTGKSLVDNSSSSVSASNPAWVLWEYLTNSRYGAGLTASQLDASSFTTSAGICNQVNDSTKRHECNIALDSANSLMSNIKQILATCNGRLHWINGKYYLHIDDDFSGTPAFAFEEKHIIGGISIIGNSKSERTNQVKAVFVNPNKSWKEDQVSWPDKNDDSITGVFTADISSSTVNLLDTAHGHLDGQELTLSSSTTLPTGLLANTKYYVVNKTTNTFQVSLSSGGSAVAFTTNGSGTLTWTKIIYDAYLLADKSVPLRKTINLAGVTNYNQARYLAKQACLRSRDALKCNFTATSEAMDVIVGDVITVTHTSPSWTAKEFRVRSISLNMDGTCSIACVEHLDSIYTWDYVTEPSASADTNLPDVTTVTAPTALVISESVYSSITSGGKRVRAELAWTDSTDTFVQKYDFQYKKSADSSWTDGGTTVSSSGVISDFEKGTFDFRVRAVNAVDSKSDWLTTTSQVITGIVTPPPDVSDFDVNILNGSANITWTMPNDADIQAGGQVQIRNLQEGSTSWEDAEILATVASTTTNVLLPLVEGNYVAKWLDSEGNESVTFVEKGLGTVYWTNTIATFDEHPAWTGTLTGLYVADNDGAKVLKFESTGYVDDFSDSMDDWIALDEMGGVETDGSFEGTTAHDLGAVFQTRVYTNKVFTSGVSDGSNYMDTWGKIDARVAWDEVRNLAGITTYISTTEDDPAGTPTWTAWKSFLIADIKARAFKVKVTFESESSSEQFKMTELSTLIDMPSRVLGDSAVTSTSVTYADPFYSAPDLVVMPTNLGNGEYYTVSAQTKTGFGINFYDSADAGITRNYNYLAKGY